MCRRAEDPLNRLDQSNGSTGWVLGDSSLHIAHGRQAATSCSHSVQFYEDHSIFLDGLSEYLASAMGAGAACLVIASADHRDGLAKRLKGWGVDLPDAVETFRYTPLDAEDTLEQFMVDGWPNETLFLEVIEARLRRARRALRREATRVAAYGEMVAVLWARGECEAAVRDRKSVV